VKNIFTGKKLIIGAALMSLGIATLASATGVGAIGNNTLILHGSTTLGPSMVAAAPLFNAYENSLGSGNPQIDINSIIQNGSSNGIADLRNAATGVVASITITNGGSGYTSAPTVTFTGTPGSGAAALATLGTGANAGKVVSVDITARGSGYTTAPTIGFTGGSGSGATATSALSAGQLCDLAMSSRPLKSSDAGTTCTPVARDALCIIVNETVPSYITSLTELQIKGIFEGVYTTWDSPAVTIGNAGIQGVDNQGNQFYDKNMVFPQLGDGLGTGPAIVVKSRIVGSGTRSFIGSSDTAVFTGTTATATATISGGQLTGLTITNPGTDYNAQPGVTLTGGGFTTAATVVAEYDGYGHISSFLITSPGAGYTSAPSVTIGTTAVLGCNFAKNGTNLDAAGDSNYALEQKVSGITDANRIDANVDEQSFVNNDANGASIGYVGLGFGHTSGAGTPGAKIRDIPVVNPLDGNAYYPTAINAYSYYYPLSRYLYLVNLTSDHNSAISTLVTWMTQLDGQGQATVAQQGFLKLEPNEDVIIDGTSAINISDIGEVGNHFGLSSTTDAHWNPRAAVLGRSYVDISDIGDVGNWFGVNLANYPHPVSEP
jgi:ABC-type phosphate transport system substrate-binding protein